MKGEAMPCKVSPTQMIQRWLGRPNIDVVPIITKLTVCKNIPRMFYNLGGKSMKGRVQLAIT